MNIYKMKLHERNEIDKYRSVLRVAGGWIYEFYADGDGPGSFRVSAIFVPWHPEFCEANKPEPF